MNAQQTRQTSRVAGVLASLLLVAVNSQAAPLVYCEPTATTTSWGMTVNDMTFGSVLAASPADACKWTPHVPGSGSDAIKPNVAGINLLWGSATDPFSFLAKWDIGTRGTSTPGTAFGFSWALSPIPASTSGTYTLTATAIGSPPIALPHIFDFVGVLKAGPGFGSWFFDNRLFSGTGGGTWEIKFKNPGGNIPDLSHLSIFGRSVGSPPPPPPPNGVPTPGTLSLVGLALLAGWAAAARRRRIAPA
jgi:hypothetical protein